MADVKIECPRCGWEPDGGEYWGCTCGHIWDTFKTAARCPACGKQWTHTACIPHRGGCHSMPPHIDWYKGLDEWLREELEKIKEHEPAGASAEARGTLHIRSPLPILPPYH